MEKWKPINGYKNLYEISNLGNIKSLPKWQGFVYSNEKIFNPKPNVLGYIRVSLVNKRGQRKCFLVHRIVAKHFLPTPPKNKRFVNHKNCIKTDNRVENLEWCNHKENIRHAIDNKLRNAPKGEKSNLSKLTSKEVLEIRAIYPIIKSYKRLSIMYSVSFGTIIGIIKNKTWFHI